jgi:hypothetical protein
MTVPAPLVFPGSRTLAGWWRQLTSWQPRSWWVGHILLHRVEALAEVRPLTPLDPLHRLVLQVLALAPNASVEALDQRLNLGRQLLNQLLRTLQHDGLTTTESERCVLTERGRLAQQQGEYERTIYERRSFSFADSENASRPPLFLSIDPALCVPWNAGEGWQFSPALLAECVAQPPEWKQRFGFPRDVRKIVTASGEGSPPAWQRVIVDRPERLPAVVVQAEDQRLLGFAVRQDSWSLQSEEPVFTFDRNDPEVLPQLVDGPTVANWQLAWQSWCQPRSLTGLGAEDCTLMPEGHRLRVKVPARLLERLRATRSEALKGEAWLLSGGGRLRAAALVEIVEEG